MLPANIGKTRQNHEYMCPGCVYFLQKPEHGPEEKFASVGVDDNWVECTIMLAHTNGLTAECFRHTFRQSITCSWLGNYTLER